MLGSYARVYAAPGAKAFSVAGLIARMPISMMGVGLVLAIQQGKAGYGVAGLVAGTYSLVQALVGPWLGRFVDRYGQRAVLLPAVLVCVVGLSTLMLEISVDAPAWTMFPAAAVAGAAMPSFGALVRARWAKIYAGKPELHTAYSVESVLDEVVFVIGPVLVTFLATGVARLAGLVAVLAFLLTGSSALMVQRATEPTPARTARRRSRFVLTLPGMPVLFVAFMCMGCLFGSVEVTTVAFAGEHGHRSAAGVLLAVYALGSMISGLLFGTRHWRMPLHRRFPLLLAVFAVVTAPMPLQSGMVTLGIALFVAGLAISPTIITGVGLVERLVPSTRLTEGLTLGIAGLGLGVTAGSAISGSLIDHVGAQHAYVLGVVATALGLLTGLIGSRWLRSGSEQERAATPAGLDV